MIVRHRILAHILGGTDAAFAPWRRWARSVDHGVAEAYRWRRDHLARIGIPWVSPGDSEDERRDSLGALGELVREGLAIATRSRSKVTAARLTDAGDTLARSLCGLPTLSDAAELFDDFGLMDRLGYVGDALGGSWTPEWALAGLEPYWADASDPGNRARLVQLEEAMLPLLARGLAERGSDYDGRTWYRLTGDRPDLGEPIRHDPDDDARSAYYAAFEAARHRLATTPRSHDGELGEIPLPCSIALRDGPPAPEPITLDTTDASR